MRIVGKLQHTRSHFPLARKTNDTHSAIRQTEMRAKKRIGNIENSAQKRHTETFVRKQSNPLFIGRNGMIETFFFVVFVSERFQKRIRFPPHALHAVLITERGECGVLVPLLSEQQNFPTFKQLPRFIVLKQPTPFPISLFVKNS